MNDTVGGVVVSLENYSIAKTEVDSDTGRVLDNVKGGDLGNYRICYMC